MIRLSLPLPPSVNAAYATVGNRRIKSKAYRDWLKQADNYLLMQKRTYTPIVGPYTLRIIIPKSARGDCTNYIKLVEDALVSREVTSDDKFCQMASAERDDTVPSGMCRIEIEEATIIGVIE